MNIIIILKDLEMAKMKVKMINNKEIKIIKEFISIMYKLFELARNGKKEY